jgi:hypothetical protein
MTDAAKLVLTPVQSRFILHWGEMGWRWGINRTVAQVHALLFIAKPGCGRIAATLGSRGRTSATAFGSCRAGRSFASPTFSATAATIRASGHLGLFRIIVDERKKREAD